jgi:hypothetical protein
MRRPSQLSFDTINPISARACALMTPSTIGDSCATRQTWFDSKDDKWRWLVCDVLDVCGEGDLDWFTLSSPSIIQTGHATPRSFVYLLATGVDSGNPVLEQWSSYSLRANAEAFIRLTDPEWIESLPSLSFSRSSRENSDHCLVLKCCAVSLMVLFSPKDNHRRRRLGARLSSQFRHFLHYTLGH